MNDDEIGEQVRGAAQRAIADIPVQSPGPDFYARIGRPRQMPRRYVGYAVAAAAAVVAIVFGVVVLQDPDTTAVDTASAPPTQPGPSITTTTPELADPIAVQIAEDTAIAAALGLTIGEPVVEPDGSIVMDSQPDLIAFIADGAVVGYSKPTEVFGDVGGTPYGVYGPDGATLRGRVDRSGTFTPVG